MCEKNRQMFVRVESGNDLLFSAEAARLVGDRIDILGRDGVYAVVSGPEGHYRLHPAGRGRKLLCSPGLVSCVMEHTDCEVGAILPVWFPWEDDGTPFFSALLPKGYRHRSLDDGYLLLNFPEGEALTGEAYLTPTAGWSYYVSSLAAEYLKEGFFLYEMDDYLALRPAVNGEFRVVRDRSGWKHTVSARALKELLSRRFSDARRLWLRPHGDLLVVSMERKRGEPLPPWKSFYRVDLLHRGDGTQWARLDPDRVYLWRSCGTLGDRVSVYETKNAVYLKNDLKGRFPVKRDGQLSILSQALSDYMSKKFGGEHYLKALSIPEGVVLFHRCSGVEAADLRYARAIDDLFKRFYTHRGTYIYLPQNGRFLEFSSSLAPSLGSRADVWVAPGAVAFLTAEEGGARLRPVGAQSRRLRINDTRLARWLRDNIGPGPRLSAQPMERGVICFAQGAELARLDQLSWARAATLAEGMDIQVRHRPEKPRQWSRPPWSVGASIQELPVRRLDPRAP